MRRNLIGLVMVALGAGCLNPAQSALTYKNQVPPRVIGTVPSFDGGSACFPTSPNSDAGIIIASLAQGVPAQVIFSETMDVNTLRPGIGLFQCPCTPDQLVEVPTELSVLSATDLPDYGQITQGLYPFTVQITPALDGNPCQPDGGTFGCFTSALYLWQIRTLLTDTAGNPLEQECQVNFESL